MSLTKPKRVRSPDPGRSRRPKTVREPAPSGDLPDASGGRRQVLIYEAAHLFADKGYKNTSMRDIAAAMGILPGSLYHHFPSKEDLFVAVYSFAVSQTLDIVGTAIADHDDPWDRLEAACIAHLQNLLEKSRFAAVLTAHPSLDTLPQHEQAIRLRDRYETIFKDLVADLPLPADIDRQIFRLGLLGSLNWAIHWYRPDGEPPAMIAKKLLAAIRRQ